jgi:hypothetical protein
MLIDVIHVLVCLVAKWTVTRALGGIWDIRTSMTRFLKSTHQHLSTVSLLLLYPEKE